LVNERSLPSTNERAPLSREIAVAATALAMLRTGRALPAALDAALDAARQGPAPLPFRSRPAVRDMAHEAVRRLGLVDAIAAALNRRPPTPPLAALQAVALSQLIEPVRASAIIVDQAVAAARTQPATTAAAGFLNATLRRFLREREALLEKALEDPVARWNHPLWWIEALRHDHPRHWESILEVGNRLPPMSLRVHRRIDPEDYRRRLTEAGLEAVRVGEQALVLAQPVAIDALPGWQEGEVSVQDAGAQLAAPLLAPRPGDRVLDACAAPGGKSTHLLELADCELTALDVVEERLAPVRENLERLGQQARVLRGDARRPEDWWDGKPFDRILVDAPCTASGIVRRHPDIRWLRRRSDIATLSGQQSGILAALWPLLGEGGRLLYVTCSVFTAENEAVIARFLAGQPSAVRLPIQGRLGASEQGLAQLLPSATAERDHDGFFYALLEKRS
jgi:16S rRNA (cytosine967-C5)-methyltransferase